MFGWLRPRSALVSRSKTLRVSSSDDATTNLTATWLPSRVSTPFRTVDNPPAPPVCVQQDVVRPDLLRHDSSNKQPASRLLASVKSHSPKTAYGTLPRTAQGRSLPAPPAELTCSVRVL